MVREILRKRVCRGRSCELLEQRLLLSGNTIMGTVFDDLNGNGVKDAGEPGMAGVVVTLTSIFSPSPSTSTTTSDGNGAYAFPSLADVTYTASIFQSIPANRKITSRGTPGGLVPFIGVSQGQTVNADLGSTTFSKSPLLDPTFGVLS
jgi:hypothetical protein